MNILINLLMKKSYLFVILIVLLIYLIIYFRVIADTDILILTIDDITLTNEYEINMTDKLIDLIDQHNLSATFFAIPANMIEYDFPENIEIAQHGYDHLNPITNKYSEFKGLNNSEIQNRVIVGKQKLNKLGYNVSGFRAPSLYLKKENLNFLKQNYLYDSSFLFAPKNDFVIPIILDDFTMLVCNEKSCNSLWLTFRKVHTKNMIYIYDFLNKPIVLITHYWNYEKILRFENGRKYVDDIFYFISKENYDLMTMQEYAIKK